MGILQIFVLATVPGEGFGLGISDSLRMKKLKTYNMKIIGIDIKKGSTAVIHNLKPGWYPFGSYPKPNIGMKYPEQDWEKPVKGLYQIFDKMPEVNVCAIVGNNGSGKSTIIDIMFRMINNLAYVLLDGKADSLEVEDADTIRTGRKLSYAYGLWASLYFETNNILGLITCEGDEMSYIYQDKKKNQVRTYHHNDLKRGDNGGEEILRAFFYTISCNYSQYAFRRDDYLPLTNLPEDKNVNGEWLTGIYHKNDGYLAPLVMTPYREDGLIDFDKENKLSQQRLVVLSVLFYIQGKQFIEGYNPKHIVYSLDLKYRDGRIGALRKVSVIFDTEQLVMLMDVFQSRWRFHLNKEYEAKRLDMIKDNEGKDKKDIERTENKLKEEFELTIYYLAYKSLKICLVYRQYQKMLSVTYLARLAKRGNIHFKKYIEETTFRNKVNRIVKNIMKDESHVALKIHQCMAFYAGTTIDSKNHVIDIDDYVGGLNGYTYDDIVKELPPSYYNVDVTLMPNKKAKKRSDQISMWPMKDAPYERGEIRFSQMSSGERQLMNSLSYIVYHIKNLQSIKNTQNTVAYRHVNIIFDEAELYAHPNFQRDFVYKLLETIHWCHIDRRKIKSINIILATHSPFVLSDVLSQKSLYLEEGHSVEIKGQSFGGNYYSLLENSFFFKESAMGRISTQRIEEWIDSFEKYRKKNNSGYMDMTPYIGDPIVNQYMEDSWIVDKTENNV